MVVWQGEVRDQPERGRSLGEGASARWLRQQMERRGEDSRVVGKGRTVEHQDEISRETVEHTKLPKVEML